ncbi:MAG: DUF2207 family protein [Clostridia bacterium]
MNKFSSIITKILLFGFMGIVVAAILFSYFFPSQTTLEDNSSEYTISNYHITATYGKNNTLQMMETIDVDFATLKHGIFRAMPEVSTVKLFDENGNEKINGKFRLKYGNVSANTHFETDSSGDVFFLRLGSENSYAHAHERYKISYTITLDERFARYDVFYFNLLGNLTDTTIDNFSATVNFENPITAESTVYVGALGSTATITPVWNAEQTSFSITAQNLGVGHGVTALVNLPENYSTVQPNFFWDWFMLVAIILVAIGAWLLFKKHSNKSIITPVVQFSADKKYTSADVGFIIDKRVNTEDVASLIIYWAQKGFVNIIEDGKKTYLSRTEKEFSGKMYEKQLFFAIFSHNNPGEKIDIKKIGLSIAEDVGEVKKGVALENEHLFNPKATFARGLIIIMTSIILALSICLIANQAVKNLFFFAGIIVGVASAIFLFQIAKAADKKYALNAKKSTLNGIMFFLFLAGVLAVCICVFDAYADAFFTVFLAFGLLCFASYLVLKFNVRTGVGCAELGDIIGLKTFIEVAEKDRLEMLVKENPQAFYQILPYAYVLGVYDTWCKKFESIDIGAPTFYSGEIDVFDVLIIAHILDHATQSILSSINAANIANVAESVSRTVGGFTGGGGGGFSGGGLGGGGTGSW